MLILLSPAKQLDFSERGQAPTKTRPALIERTKELIIRYEEAIDALSSGAQSSFRTVQSYSLDAGGADAPERDARQPGDAPAA